MVSAGKTSRRHGIRRTEGETTIQTGNKKKEDTKRNHVRMECGKPTEKDKQANQSTDYKQLLTLCTSTNADLYRQSKYQHREWKTHQYVLFVCKAINQQSEQFTIG